MNNTGKVEYTFSFKEAYMSSDMACLYDYKTAVSNDLLNFIMVHH